MNLNNKNMKNIKIKLMTKETRLEEEISKKRSA